MDWLPCLKMPATINRRGNTMARVLGTSHKVELSESVGVLTSVLYLSPASESGRNLCPSSTAGCRAACLGHSSGKMVFPTHKAARIRKSLQLQNDRAAFLADVRKDIAALVRKAQREGLQAAVRLNGSSDIGWESIAPELFAEFPEVHFYDYTKRASRMMRSLTSPTWPANYRLTFSRSGENDSEMADVIAAGGNVAVVFATLTEIPTEYQGTRVISGEAHDYRYGDARGVIVGLRARGKATRDTSGFVVRA